MKKLFKLHDKVHKENFNAVMEQAITLELATIPTYLSTYYSIQRTFEQDELLKRINKMLTVPKGNFLKVSPEGLAQELTLDVMVYANKTAALIMGVVIEEMLHLALASNVKQAICQEPPNLPGIGKVLKFPTQLDGHEPEFPINLGPLSLDQLTTFLKIESPNAFSQKDASAKARNLEYTTIGKFYEQIKESIMRDFPGIYDLGDRLQLTPDPGQAIYAPNSVNSLYYDRDHNPHFVNAHDGGGLVHVKDVETALEALNEIVEQGEGNPDPKDRDRFTLDEHGRPVPLPMVDGKVQFKDGDYDNPEKTELSHFFKFMEAYTLGRHYQEKFAAYGIDFFKIITHPQALSPTQADYANATRVTNADTRIKKGQQQAALLAVSELGNALFTYVLLMIETCYVTTSRKIQFQIFMFGVHKAMIWLISQYGGTLTKFSYDHDGTTYAAGLTFENFDFDKNKKVRPKQQLLQMATDLEKIWPTGGWQAFLQDLPDISTDFKVENIEKSLNIPASDGPPSKKSKNPLA